MPRGDLGSTVSQLRIKSNCSGAVDDFTRRMPPILSIIIPARDGAATIEECLASIEPQLDERVEVIVADGSGGNTASQVAARFPWTRLVDSGPRSAAELRRDAFAVARGELIALAEPHVVFAPGWIAAALASGRWRSSAVGGVVEPGPRRVRGIGAWAAFLCEYADFLPPMTVGPTRLTTGNNVIYPRAALEGSDLCDGLAKAWVNDRLARQGATFWTDPSLVVRHERPYSFRVFLNKRFHYGRCYGATRAKGWSFGRRLVRTLSTLLLPGVFSWRIARAVLRKPRYWLPLVAAQPLLLIFHTSWAIGEACGYTRGAGDSCAQVY